MSIYRYILIVLFLMDTHVAYSMTDIRSQKNSDIPFKRYENILVYGGFNSFDCSRFAEEKLIQELKERTDIKVSIKLRDIFSLSENYSDEQVVDRLSKLKIDAILIIKQILSGNNQAGNPTGDYIAEFKSYNDKIVWSATASSQGSIFSTQKSLVGGIVKKVIDQMLNDHVLNKFTLEQNPTLYQKSIDDMMSLNNVLKEKEELKAIRILTEKSIAAETEKAKVIAEHRIAIVENRIIRAKLKIGDKYSGGIVFLIRQPGQPGYVMGEVHGLIAANADLSGGLSWYEATNACNYLEYGGYKDWYLPRKGELNILYIQKNTIGGFASSPYWSSSEVSTNTAIYQDFGSFGIQGEDNKENRGYVRPIRAF